MNVKHLKLKVLVLVFVLSGITTAQISAINPGGSGSTNWENLLDHFGDTFDWYAVSHASTANDLDVLVNTDMSGVTEAIVYVDTDCTASANITTGESIYWVFAPDASATINTGTVTTIQSPDHIRAGQRQQCFVVSATDDLVFSKGGTVHPEWFGENTTPGTTDMRDEINYACDTISSAGGRVLFQPEVYYVPVSDGSTSAIVGIGNTIYEGTPYKTIIRDYVRPSTLETASQAGSASAFSFTSVDNVTIRGMRFEGNLGFQTGGTSGNYRVKDCQFFGIIPGQSSTEANANLTIGSTGSIFRFKNCEFSGSNNGLRLNSGNDFIIEDCEFENTTRRWTGYPTGIYLLNNDDTIIRDCRFKNIVSDVSGLGQDTYLQSTRNVAYCRASGLNFEADSTSTLKLSSGSWNSTSSSSPNYNLKFANGNSITLANTASNDGTYTITGLSGDTLTFAGTPFTVESYTGSEIIVFTFDGVPGYAIYAGDGAVTNMTVENCLFEHTDSSQDTLDHILASTVTGKLIIRNNNFTSSQAGGGTRAILVGSNNSSRVDMEIVGNTSDMDGCNIVFNISKTAPTAETNMLVSENVLSSGTANTLEIYVNELCNVTITNNVILESGQHAINLVAGSALANHNYNAVISNNKILGADKAGIVMTYCIDPVVMGNILEDINQDNLAAGSSNVSNAGISTNAGHGGTFIGNICYNTTAGGGRAKHGLNLVSTNSTGQHLYSKPIYHGNNFLTEDVPVFAGYTAAPTSGIKWVVGDYVKDETPAAGAPWGWFCVSRVETEVRVSVSSGTTLEVDSTTGMTAGDILMLELDTGSYHLTDIASVTDGDTLELSNAVPSAVAVDNDVISNLWKATANLP